MRSKWRLSRPVPCVAWSWDAAGQPVLSHLHPQNTSRRTSSVQEVTREESVINKLRRLPFPEA